MTVSPNPFADSPRQELDLEFLESNTVLVSGRAADGSDFFVRDPSSPAGVRGGAGPVS